MSAQLHHAQDTAVATSCGTLIINPCGDILLCHVTGTRHWDIPKGVRHHDECCFTAARRELFEETGLRLDDGLFAELGGFDYLAEKRLHLFIAHVPHGMVEPAHLVCHSHFRQQDSGLMLPEMDDYRWASRDDVPRLCTLRLARQLLALPW